VIPLVEIERARRVIDGVAVRTPLIRLDVDADAEIHLKLETLQPVNSFKIRGAGNAVLQATDDELRDGVLTASAGNMAQGIALAARLRGVPATIVVPDHAPAAKLDAIARLGGHVIKVPYDEWWQVLVNGSYEGAPGFFVHPVADDRVMAGNGTIGLELLEQLSDFDAVIVPYGGGGLLTGVASAVKATRPEVKFYAAEPETAAPVAASLAAGEPTAVEYVPSFVDGSGSRELIPKVWAHAVELLEDGFAIPLADVEAAVRTLATRTRVIAEGAGALSVAAALTGRVPNARKVVCIVSGGNIDLEVLTNILQKETAT
jgi:threonine dehydratase